MYGGRYAQRRARAARARTAKLIGVAALCCTVIALGIVGLRAMLRPRNDATAAMTLAAQTTALPQETPAAQETIAPQEMAAPQETVVPQETPQSTDAPLPPLQMVTEYSLLQGIPNTDRAIGLVETPRVADSYFNDTVFVGDSVTRKLQQYVLNERKSTPELLGNARFLAAQNFSCRNALKEVTETSIHPTIAGQKMTLEDALVELGAKKIYIMLGMNDVGISGADTAVQNMGKLVTRILEKSPNIQVFIQSATPRVSGSHPNTSQLFEYDVKLYRAILEFNDPRISFVDVAYVMRDAEGKLIEDYCSDLDSMALHFNNEGCRRWIDYLYTHARV